MLFFYIGTHGTGLKHGNMATFVTKLELVSGKGEVIYLSFIPGLPTVQVLIACSMQKKKKEHDPFYQVHDVSVYLGRQRRGEILDWINKVEAFFNSFCPMHEMCFSKWGPFPPLFTST